MKYLLFFVILSPLMAFAQLLPNQKYVVGVNTNSSGSASYTYFQIPMGDLMGFDSSQNMYGFAASKVAGTGLFSDLLGLPTTLGGYGITNGAATNGSYPDPAWITSLASSKITPALGTAAFQAVSAFVQPGSNVSNLANDVPYLTSSALSGYVTSSSLSSTLAGYATTSALTSGLSGKYANPVGTTTQYLRGDGALATFPTIPAAQVNSDWSAGSGVSQILNKPTLGTAAAMASTAFATAAQGALATSAIQTFNVGTVTGLSAGSAPTVANVGTATALVLNFGIPAGSQGIQGTAGSNGTNGSNGSAATIAVGTVTGLSAGSSPTITNSGSSSAAVFNFGIPAGAQGIQGTTGSTGGVGATGSTGATGTAATVAVGTVTTLAPGASATVTNSGSSSAATLNFGIPAGPARTFTNNASRTIQTVAAMANGTQLSATSDTHVSYSVSITTTTTIGGPATGYVVLEVCATNSATAANWQEISRSGNSQTATLAVVLQLTTVSSSAVVGVVQAGYYVRLRSVSSSGSPTFAYVSGQEVQF